MDFNHVLTTYTVSTRYKHIFALFLVGTYKYTQLGQQM